MTTPRAPRGLGAWSALLAVLAALSVGACEGRPRAHGGPATRSDPGEPHVAELDLGAGLPERESTSLLGDGAEDSFADFVLAVRELEDDSRVRGVLVRFGSTSLGLGRAEEAGALLGRLRGRGLHATCHADGYGNATLLLAALGCDEVWLSPAGDVDSVGLAAQLVFGRALLERLKVSADFLQEGKYKGASEPFLRDGPSPEARESLRTALTGLRSAWLLGIAAGRGKTAEQLGLEDGPHTAEAARERALVDALGFEDEARAAALRGAGLQNVVVRFGGAARRPGGVGRLLRWLTPASATRTPHVAVVRASGAIALGAGGLLGGGDGIGARELDAVLRRLREDPATRAVVLRIDSPGGSALASDLLWHALMRLRADKPLAVSVGGMAASGGYYLASAAHRVFADATSIVGSIGVVGGKLSFARSLAELGVHVEAVTPTPDPDGRAAARALYGSPLAAWDEATRAKVGSAIRGAYELFLARIAEGRGLERPRLDAAAEGRLMGGRDALAAGLVDEIGGLEAALAWAYREATLDPRAPVELVSPPSGLLSMLGLGAARAPDAATGEGDSPDPSGPAALRVAALARRAARDALLGPFGSDGVAVGLYLDSLAPLLGDEGVAAALPFALVLR
ncbi:MAG: S49 family peptidase [Polyangiaceae bacterium]|nr:S49 family peptidase [Polyangiaceae bacterium]